MNARSGFTGNLQSLGKTFTALAVITYYENRNKSVLVLCPKKLAENWNTYKDNYVNNPIAADRLNYAVLFHTDLSRAHGKNKIAATTINLAAGQSVEELQVFEIRLNQPSLDEGVLRQIDKKIPYHILYLLEYEDKYQTWIAYKEIAGSGSAAFKVNQYYHTDWLPEEELPLKLEGLSTDAVYENFIRQIAGAQLYAAPAESLRDSVERSQQRAALQKQIDKLQAKIRKEKQLNRQMEIKILKEKLRRLRYAD